MSCGIIYMYLCVSLKYAAFVRLHTNKGPSMATPNQLPQIISMHAEIRILQTQGTHSYYDLWECCVLDTCFRRNCSVEEKLGFILIL
jgi:hypothetical protein